MCQSEYMVCGVSFRIVTGQALPQIQLGNRFQTSLNEADITIQVEAVPEIPVPDEGFCGNSGEERIWKTDGKIFRVTHDLFRHDAHIAIRYEVGNPAHAVAMIRAADWVWAATAKYFWPGIGIHELLLPFRTLIFHASYIGWQGEGLLFTAPSGVGKSTQAELWRRYRRAEVLNGDKAGVRLEGEPMVYGVPFSGTSGICRNVSLPLRGIVVLSQAAENTIRRLLPSEAVAALCPNVFVDSAVQEEWQMAVQLLLDLVSAVPVYALACTPDESAVETLEAALSR